MSSVGSVTDRDVQPIESIKQVYREYVETLEKLDRVARVVLDASGQIRWRSSEKDEILTQITETVTVVSNNKTDLIYMSSNVCTSLLKKHYLPFSKTASGEHVVEADFSLTVELRDANDNLLQDRVWTFVK